MTNDQVKDVGMGRACRGEEECMKGFWWESQKEREH
jgi:hypothetical protein